MRYGIPGDFGKRTLSTMVCDYGCPPPDQRVEPWPPPTPPTWTLPNPVGGTVEPTALGSACNLVESVRQRLVEARQSRSTLDAEIETLEKMLRAAGVET
jgi:hypothetical protein